MFSIKTKFNQGWSLWIVVAAGALVSLAAGCATRSEASPDLNEVAIAVATAAPAGPSSIYEGPGSVTARQVYDLAFEVPGTVAAVNVDVGERVAKGTVLARLSSDDYAAQAAAADAQASAAQAEAAKAQRGARTQERAAAQASVAAAQGQLDRALAAETLARANASRARSLFASGAIAAQQADAATAALHDAEGNVDAARAQLESAGEQASLVDEGARAEDRTAAQAQYEAAAAQAQLAHITFDKTVLRAPADGIVERRAVEPGDEAQPGAVVFTLEDARAPDVTIAVPERYAAALRVGDSAIVSTGRRSIGATIYSIEPAADAASRTAEVRVRSNAIDLPFGAVVDVALGSAQHTGARVPFGAVLSDPASASRKVELYDAAAHTVRYQAVRIVGEQGDDLIVEGVAAGQPVVVAGEYQAKPGSRVRIVPAETNP